MVKLSPGITLQSSNDPWSILLLRKTYLTNICSTFNSHSILVLLLLRLSICYYKIICYFKFQDSISCLILFSKPAILIHLFIFYTIFPMWPFNYPDKRFVLLGLIHSHPPKIVSTIPSCLPVSLSLIYNCWSIL